MLHFLIFLKQVSKGKSQVFYIAEDDFWTDPFALYLPNARISGRHHHACFYRVLRVEPWACCLLCKCSTNWNTSSPHDNAFMENRTCHRTRCCWFCGARWRKGMDGQHKILVLLYSSGHSWSRRWSQLLLCLPHWPQQSTCGQPWTPAHSSELPFQKSQPLFPQRHLSFPNSEEKFPGHNSPPALIWGKKLELYFLSCFLGLSKLWTSHR